MCFAMTVIEYLFCLSSARSSAVVSPITPAPRTTTLLLVAMLDAGANESVSEYVDLNDAPKKVAKIK